MSALLGKLFHHIHELPPAMSQTVTKNRLQFARQIPRYRQEWTSRSSRESDYFFSDATYSFHSSSTVLPVYSFHRMSLYLPCHMATLSFATIS